jgi:hypothetical protein
MKKILKLSLAAMAIAALAACGGGGSDDAADIYVGTWKSACYSTDSNTGTVYTKRIRTFSKATATELASSTILDSVFSDAACKTIAGTWTDNSPVALKYVLGAKVQFLGANTDSYISTTPSGSTFAGYMVVNGTQMFLADSPTGSAAPTGWGKFSPYTKQ